MISFIVVHYKTYDYTKQAIQSVLNTVKAHAFEVIVVDNASKDGSLALLERDFKNEKNANLIHFIESPINGGFSYGNNCGYRIAQGDYIVLINSDAELTGDVVDNAIKYLERNPQLGAVTARLINQYGELDQACKRGFPNPKSAFVYYTRLGRLFPKLKKFNTYKLNHLDEHVRHRVDAISGAFMVIPRRVIEQTGFFDETFFMYGEDLDLCYRIHEAGYHIEYNPSLGDVVHYKGQSGKRLKFKTTYEFYRAMLIFYDKHYKDIYPFGVNIAVRSAVYMLLIMKLSIGQIFALLRR